MDVFQIVKTIKDFFISIDWQEVVSVGKIVSGVISALLFIGIVELII